MFPSRSFWNCFCSYYVSQSCSGLVERLETIWLRKLESSSNEKEMTNFTVYIIVSVFTNYAFEILGLGLSEESKERCVVNKIVLEPYRNIDDEELQIT